MRKVVGSNPGDNLYRMYIFLSLFCGSIEKRRLRDFFEEKLETLDFEKKIEEERQQCDEAKKKESFESTFFDWNLEFGIGIGIGSGAIYHLL